MSEKQSKPFPVAFPDGEQFRGTDLDECEVEFARADERDLNEWAIIQPEDTYISVDMEVRVDGQSLKIGGGGGYGPTRWELRRVDLTEREIEGDQ